MKYKCFAVIAAAILTAFPAAVAQPGYYSPQSPSGYSAVPPGTNVTIRLTQRLDTDTDQSGEIFHGVLDQDVIGPNGQVLARAGAPVEGRLIDVEKPGRLSGRARMALTLIGIQTPQGFMPVSTNTITAEADPRLKQNAGFIGGGAALGAIIGAIAGGGTGAAIGAGAGAAAGTGGTMIKGGKDVEFQPEQRFNFITGQGAPGIPAGGYGSSYGAGAYGPPSYPPPGTGSTGYAPAPIGEVAGNLNDNTQEMWNLVTSDSRPFSTQTPEGYNLYMSLSRFTQDADMLDRTVTQYPTSYNVPTVQRMIGEAQEINNLMSRVPVSQRMASDWSRVQSDLAGLSSAFGLRYTPATPSAG